MTGVPKAILNAVYGKPLGKALSEPPKDWDGVKGIAPKQVYGPYNVLPECPKCHEQNQDWWDGVLIQVTDGSVWPGTCGSCGTNYKIKVMVNTLFTTKIDP